MSNKDNDSTSREVANRAVAGRRRFLQMAGAGSVAALAGCLAGDNGGGGGGGDGGDWEPSQSIRYIVPYDQGGGTDVYARGIQEGLAEATGQSIQIDNIPGAGGLNGFGELMGSQPDGHTILGSATPLEVAPQLLEDPGFDQRDAEGVCVFGQSAWTLVVNSEYEGQVETFDDVIQMYNSGEWETIGVQEPGSSQDIIVLLARYQMEEYDWQWTNRAQYTGTGPVSQAVASGEVPAGIGTDAGTQSVVENGRIYPVVSFVSDGTEVYPDLPSVTDEGYPEMDFVGGLSRGVFAPPETEGSRTQALSDMFAEAVEADSTQSWSDDTGNPVFHEGPDAANQLLDDAFAAYEENNVVQLVEENA
ncbi:tripartite tricarboxylate transporter substrate binding protein [Halalkalicoccus sp. NIPERK01]|uniref:Bug family tripartite tricarboxylate transporter substrate binding protein n=1 Tax=Halalkalicoccus sp. NIPERK01 TaxID=3053469 RepID=UPI00256EE816|nr:tripartite tricarboxylate transporter substrate-binding protein [Halalkalicoccus sp. NIPERK01]MDL5360747.1 tripartite tricarboxylate transporter substrate-binding protein [Halalkalicoccus sp. NIPERK01]